MTLRVLVTAKAAAMAGGDPFADDPPDDRDGGS